MRALLLIAMAVAALAAADVPAPRVVTVDAPAPHGAEATERSGGGVTVVVPPDWRDAPPAGAALALESPHADDDDARRAAGRLAVVVAASDAADTATARARAVADLERVATGLQVLDERDQVVAGRTWHRLRLRLRTGQLGWQQILAIAVDHGRVAIVALSSDIADAASWTAAFDVAIASLRWDPAAPLDAAP